MKELFAGFVGLCICVSVATGAAAQYYFCNEKYYASDWIVETGGSAGLMNNLTDVGGRKGTGKGFIKDLNWAVAKPSFSLYAVAMYKNAIGLRIEGSSGLIASDDHLLKKRDANLGERYGRNLSFRSRILDLQLVAEIHPLFFRRYDEDESPFWSPYVVTGIGYFSFNPEASLNGHWYALHPLRLEGQGFVEYPGHPAYKLQQVNIPFGIGTRYEASPSLFIRIEITDRILFTDYLDDVSTTYIDPSLFDRYLQPGQAAIARQLYSRMKELQPGYTVTAGMKRGNEKNNDTYFTIQLKVGWVMQSRIR